MKEKKVIDYTRTYRRIEADKKKCILYIVILILLGFLLMWTQIDDLTRMICKICAGVLKKYEPHMYVGIRSETYPLFGKISYLSAGTVYPGIQISLINTGISLAAIILLAGLPWKGRPLAIYLILCSAIHLINSLWFVFGEKYFPYTLTVYSNLYMLQEIGIWVMFFVMTVMVTGIIGDRGVIYKLLTLLAVMLYSIVFGTVRYVIFIWLLYRFSVIYMAFFYFIIGPIRPLHRDCPDRGKPVGLNDAMKLAKGEIIIVFDADYRPARNMLKQIALGFEDPQVGAVMGRVIPYNTNTNMLTRLINLERSGGYQVDQQARYNLKTIPQYGGTVGGFRKDFLLETGGFNPKVLAEDTELTYRLFTNGWKVVYANSAECYEESPESWNVRGRQIRRWSRGHNEVLFRYLIPTITTPYMGLFQKIDGLFLLFIYSVPVFLLVGWVVSLGLFFLGEMQIFSGWWVILFLGIYNSLGNFAPFFEIGTSLIIDGLPGEALLLPLMMFNFFFYMWNISLGFWDAVVDTVTGRGVKWDKTVRFTVQKTEKEAEK